MDGKQIKLIRKCEWEEVFLTWYQNEGQDPHWAKLAQERGYASWADWRIKGYARRFGCEKTEWGFYEVLNPSKIILDWYGGPFRTWIEKYYGGKKTKSFAMLAAMPEIANLFKLRSIIKKYPEQSIITALQLDNGQIFVIEGMHRACALSVMARNKKDFPKKLIFAIGKSKFSKLPPVGKNKKSKQ
jgi:hypothetical protein